jgi:predicted phage terminase large subunit-like protein
VVQQTNGTTLALKCYVDLNPTTSAHWTYQMWVLGMHPDGGKPIEGHAENYRHVTVNPVDNSANLAPDYLRDLAAMPERQRRRFFEGQFTADDDNALWRRGWIRVDDPPQMGRVIVSIDPAAKSEVGSDETGIIVAGIGADGRGWVLADESGKYRPEEWARRAISLYDTYGADAIVAEVNQGGEMVAAIIRAEARGRVIQVRQVTATRAKHVRAEPIAALYEQGKVRHGGEFAALCDQLCSFTISFDRKAQGYSPDRLDALVWALTDLFPSMTQRLDRPKAVAPVSMAMPMARR